MPKTTKWDAPFGGNVSKSQIQYKPGAIVSMPMPRSPIIHFDEYGSPAKPSWWQRTKKAWRQPWHKSPAIYLPYLLLSLFMILVLLSIPRGHGHAAPAFSLGLNVGFLFMTFLNRQREKMDENFKDLERDLMRLELEAEIRAKYGI